jgi:hypothetical protein
MRKLSLVPAIACSLAAVAMPAQAAEIVLDFEGVGNFASVNNFYNGGTDSQGNSGTNYGINFSTASLGLVDGDSGGSGNFANEPSADSVLFFVSGGAATMNVAAGFDTGFSFFYATSVAGFVNVYDGLNGTGNLLATLLLPVNNTGQCQGDPSGFYCQWDPIGVSFAGTALSVDFGGSADTIAFDNITLGSATPGGGAVPEPGTWAMMLLGFGATGFAMRRSRKTRPIAQIA